MVRQYSVNIPELHVLDIIGTEETSILRLNQTELVSKGSRDYILSVREAVLRKNHCRKCNQTRHRCFGY